MGRIRESIEIASNAEKIWNYVQDYQHRQDWDVTVSEFEPIDKQNSDKAINKDTNVRVKTAGFLAAEYEATYISFEPYTVSAIKMTKPIKNVLFNNLAGSWRYKELDAEHTRFTMTFDYDMKGLLGGTFDRIMIEPTIRRLIRKSLQNLKERLEQ